MTVKTRYILALQCEGTLDELCGQPELSPASIQLQDVTALIRNLLFIIEASRELAGMATVTRCQLDAASILNQLEGSR